MKEIKVGLIGFGTVGSGTAQVLYEQASRLEKRVGAAIRLTRVADIKVDRLPDHLTAGGRIALTKDVNDIFIDPEIRIVVELVGGIEPAKSFILRAIESGKHVVTANKALLAQHGNEIFAAAQREDLMVAFEAAVGGGIPIIKSLREGLTANRIEWIAGIINGTSNFILSEMREKGASFSDALDAAQRQGYAEADPTFDVEGIDAAHKLTIMSAIGFGIPMQFKAAYTEGISKLAQEDIRYAEELGYRIKLLGIAKRRSKRPIS